MSYSSCYILISAVTIAGYDLQVLLNITVNIKSYISCYILISAVTVAGHNLQVLLDITLIIMSYNSCYILILAVTVAGHDLQINILLNVLFTEKLKNSVIIDILDCQKTGSWIRNFCAKKYHLTMMKLTIGLPI